MIKTLIYLLALSSLAARAQSEDGAYLVRAAGCADCHTVNPDQPMAGGLRLESPFGVFFTPNISPDVETGIGGWTYAQFLNALRYGRTTNGSFYYPAFPYRSYTKLTDADVQKIFTYLKSLPSSSKLNRPHSLSFPFDQRWLLWFWQTTFFSNLNVTRAERIRAGVGEFTPDLHRSPEWNRGAYLVEAVAHCTECHTSRHALGNLQMTLWMAGSRFGELNAPNITPDLETGKGGWSTQDWMRFLTSGFTPELKNPQAEMASVIRNTSALTSSDRAAMIVYLQSLPPIRNWSSP